MDVSRAIVFMRLSNREQECTHSGVVPVSLIAEVSNATVWKRSRGRIGTNGGIRLCVELVQSFATLPLTRTRFGLEKIGV